MRKKWYIQGEFCGLTKKKTKTSHCNNRALFTRKAPTKNLTSKPVTPFEPELTETDVPLKVFSERFGARFDNKNFMV